MMNLCHILPSWSAPDACMHTKTLNPMNFPSSLGVMQSLIHSTAAVAVHYLPRSCRSTWAAPLAKLCRYCFRTTNRRGGRRAFLQRARYFIVERGWQMANLKEIAGGFGEEASATKQLHA
jgi:hypothetical protein